MANVNNPNGLRPEMRSLGGGPIETELYTKLASYAKPIRKWDAVTLLGTGYLGVAADITPGTTNYLGVSLDYAATSVLSDHLIVCNPQAVFNCQDNDGATGFVLADRGQNCNLVLTDGGTPTVEQSANVLGRSTQGTTATLDVKLLKLAGMGVNTLAVAPDNAYGPNSRWEIIFNKHLLVPGIAGV